MLFCRVHWYALPKKIRDAVWREYRAGQETSKRPTVRYMAVQRLAVMYSAFRPNDEAAARICARYLVQAEMYRERALALGLGDPLKGLVPA